MTATFPGAIRSFTTKVNLVDAPDAEHINSLQEEVVAIETELLKTYRVRAWDSTQFNLATSGTLYPIPFPYETYDTFNFHDNITNNTRLTCTKAGIYLIMGVINYVANATGNRDALIRLNGSTYIGDMRLQAMASGVTKVPVSTFYPLALGDYIELIGRQYSGGALTTYYGGDYSSFFQMIKIG